MSSPQLLVIGATSGIGASLVASLSDTYEIWAASRDPGETGTASIIVWDATKSEFPADALPEKLHGMVYCPGTIRLAPFNRLDDNAFIEDYELNLMGAVRAFRAALPALKAADRASVVMFSTVAVSQGMPMHASIAAAKGAVEGLTRSLAAEMAPDIRVNAIAPSLTDTPLASGLLRTDRQRDAAAQRHPQGRIGKPEDIAAAARYLLSKDSEWVTGQVLHVDGGLSSVRLFS